MQNTSHASSRNEIEISTAFRIEKIHGVGYFVVSCHSKRNDLHASQSGSHGKDFAAVSRLVKVFVQEDIWMLNSSRIATDDVKLDASR